ncbi:MAG: DUF4430 domain-containing protein [Candidatus Spyradocola sp.]|jgi:hypothetical protein
MNKKTKIILSLVALVVVVAVFVGVYFATRPETSAGDKHITVEIVGKDDSRTVELDTDEEYLGPALEQENLISGTESEFGLYVTTVDGYTADESAQEWWCFTKGGETLNTGVDSTPIADGDAFEITLTTGW